MDSMVPLNPDLDERANRIADEIALGLVSDPDGVVQLGVDLLVTGHDGPAVVELASVSPKSRWTDVELLARAALAEVGIRIPEPSDAGWVLARHWAKQLRRGGSDTYRCASVLWGLWWTLGNPPEIGALVQLMDAWEETLPGHRDEIETELQLLADPIIVKAERSLAGLD